MKSRFQLRFVVICLMLLGLGCVPDSEQGLARYQPIPASYVNIQVNLPISELENKLNEWLDGRTMDLTLHLKKKDSLFLSLSATRALDIVFRKEKLYISIPIGIDAYIKKRFLGVDVLNHKQKVHAETVAYLSADLNWEPDWNLNFDVHWEKLEWEDDPVVQLMGLKVNLKQPLDREIRRRSEEIEDGISRALNHQLDIRKIVKNLHIKLQQPNRISKHPTTAYIETDHLGFRGSLVKSLVDTVAFLIEYQSQVKIITEISSSEHKSLPERRNALNMQPSVTVFPSLEMPLAQLSEMITSQLDNQVFSYGDIQATLENLKLINDAQRLSASVNIHGDVEGVVELSGIPVLDEDNTLMLSSLDYKLVASDAWIGTADLALHRAFELYLEEMLSVDLGPFMNDLDKMIEAGLHKAAIGEKLHFTLDFDRVSAQSINLEGQLLQIVMRVDGRGSIDLKGDVIELN